MNKYKTHVDYDSKTFIIWKGKTLKYIYNLFIKRVPKSSIKHLVTMRFKRLMQKGVILMLFQLSRVDDEETSLQLVDTWCLAILLEEF